MSRIGKPTPLTRTSITPSTTKTGILQNSGSNRVSATIVPCRPRHHSATSPSASNSSFLLISEKEVPDTTPRRSLLRSKTTAFSKKLISDHHSANLHPQRSTSHIGSYAPRHYTRGGGDETSIYSSSSRSSVSIRSSMPLVPRKFSLSVEGASSGSEEGRRLKQVVRKSLRLDHLLSHSNHHHHFHTDDRLTGSQNARGSDSSETSPSSPFTSTSSSASDTSSAYEHRLKLTAYDPANIGRPVTDITARRNGFEGRPPSIRGKILAHIPGFSDDTQRTSGDNTIGVSISLHRTSSETNHPYIAANEDLYDWCLPRVLSELYHPEYTIVPDDAGLNYGEDTVRTIIPHTVLSPPPYHYPNYAQNHPSINLVGKMGNPHQRPGRANER